MQDPLPIEPLNGPVDAVVRVPGSKSYTNRALLIAALADGHSVLRGALFSDDTDRMADSLRRLGIRVEEDREDQRFEVWGLDGLIPAEAAELFIGNAGTATRFLTAMVALGHGRYVLDGVARMRERPIQPLLDALQGLGVNARSELGTGCPPLVIEANGVAGGEVQIPGNLSSQYFSALLQIGPLTRDGLTLHVQGTMVSKPYIDITASIMADFGAPMARDAAYTVFQVEGGRHYTAREYQVEPDASSASYFFAAAALTGGRVRVENLGSGSAQGDLKFLHALEQMGCSVTWSENWIEVQGPEKLQGITIDANEFSDMAQTLSALGPFVEGQLEIRNIAHNRVKECDRIDASATELRRLGQEVEEFPDGLRITPRPVTPAVVHTYDDHRMAMAFALVGLKAPGVAIADPGCTAKTVPNYWELLAGLRS